MKAQTPEMTARRLASAPEQYRWLVQGDDSYPARFAVVRGARSVKEVLAYLPDNYALMESFEEENGPRAPRLVVVIGGTDAMGWTLDGYVIPRLRSGSIAAQEIH